MSGWKQFIVISASLLVSSLFTFIPGWLKFTFTAADQFTVGVSLFSTFLLVDVLVLLRTAAATRQKELAQWSMEEDLDVSLTAIRQDFSQVVKKRHGEDDLFVGHYTREITGLAGDIRKSAKVEELWVRNHHFGSVDKVMKAFLGEKKPLHRSVWIMKPGERMFEADADLEYFSLFVKAAGKSGFGGVRTLCVVRSGEHLKDPRIKAFLDFYKVQRKFDCHVVLEDEYENKRTDAQLPDKFVDFGIYGTRQMFLTESYYPERKGVFVRDKSEVRKYTQFFDSIWNSQTATPNPSVAKGGMTLKQLTAIDAQETPEKTQ